MAKTSKNINIKLPALSLRLNGEIQHGSHSSGADSSESSRSHHSGSHSRRTTNYRGHQIDVETTYSITIDGRPLPIHMGVMDDGLVHCHGLPNYAFTSVLDMIKSVIDGSALAHTDGDELSAESKHAMQKDGGHKGHAQPRKKRSNKKASRKKTTKKTTRKKKARQKAAVGNKAAAKRKSARTTKKSGAK